MAVAFSATFVIIFMVVSVLNIRKDAALKRKWMPRCLWIVGSWFVIYATLCALTERGIARLVMGLGAAIFVPYLWLYPKNTRFCDTCGATNFALFQLLRFCSKCGAELDVKPKSDADHRA